MVKIRLIPLLVLLAGCTSIPGVKVAFNVRSRDKIPAKMIWLADQEDEEYYCNNYWTSFYQEKDTVFKKSTIYHVTRPRPQLPPFYIAVPNNSTTAFVLTYNPVFTNMIIKNECFNLNKLDDKQIKEIVRFFSYMELGGQFNGIINSFEDIKKDYSPNIERDVKRKAKAEQQVSDVIKPMAVTRGLNRAEVVFYYISFYEQDFVKRTLTVNYDCTIDLKSVHDEVIGKGLAPWHRTF